MKEDEQDVAIKWWNSVHLSQLDNFYCSVIPNFPTRESGNCVRTSAKILAIPLITNQLFWLPADSSINLQCGWKMKSWAISFEPWVLKKVSCGVSAFGQVFVVTGAKHWVLGGFTCDLSACGVNLRPTPKHSAARAWKPLVLRPGYQFSNNL